MLSPGTAGTHLSRVATGTPEPHTQWLRSPPKPPLLVAASNPSDSTRSASTAPRPRILHVVNASSSTPTATPVPSVVAPLPARAASPGFEEDVSRAIDAA